jgi:hypothetical protein
MSNNRNLGALLIGAMLIGFGMLSFLAQIFHGFEFWSYLWPFIIIGFGAMFFVGMFAGGKSVAGLAIPGSIITAIGLMLFVQNVTHHWESWSYGWTVILMAVGTGILIMGAWQGNPYTRAAGLRVLKVGAILFVLFGAFFEMIFSFGHRSLSSYIFPLALMALGVYLVVTRSGLLTGKGKEEDKLSQPTEPTD